MQNKKNWSLNSNYIVWPNNFNNYTIVAVELEFVSLYFTTLSKDKYSKSFLPS
jgi:hypothetical protein